MAKRKRTQTQREQPQSEFQSDKSASRLAINSYEDVPDSEDEFHINRDKVLLEELPDAKRRRQLEEDELSDEEVLAYSDDDDDDNDAIADGDADDALEAGSQNSHDADDIEDNVKGWGSSRQDYYGGDVIETEQDKLREEEAVREVQQRRLKALTEEDFGFDEANWLNADGEDETGKGEDGVITEVLPQLQINEHMSEEEKLELLSARYPEVGPLATELLDLQPSHQELLSRVRSQPKNSVSPTDSSTLEVIQYRALSAYLGAIVMYFALLTSTAEKESSKSLPLAPHHLRAHELMDQLVTCREMWSKVENIEIPSDYESAVEEHIASEDEDSDTQLKDDAGPEAIEATQNKNDKLTQILNSTTAASLRRRKERLQKTEDSLALLTAQLKTAAKHRPVLKPKKISGPRTTTTYADGDSDLGDEPEMSADVAAEKDKKRKTLRFYTSQIQQKANKRANASRVAGGDDDLPYRERFRDRAERLNKEAEKRGRRSTKDDPSIKLDGRDDGDDAGPTNRMREDGIGDGDTYGADLEAQVREKKEDRRRRDEVYRQAKEEGGTVVQRVEADDTQPDGRRKIGYVIQKNKGLTPRRKKEAKNPRLKKRKKYEDKTKKLSSMKATYKGGEGRGGYGGELTGIKKGLIRSTKL